VAIIERESFNPLAQISREVQHFPSTRTRTHRQKERQVVANETLRAVSAVAIATEDINIVSSHSTDHKS